MTRMAMAVLLVVSSASGAGAQTRYVPPDMVVYVDCLRRQASAIDDAVSDAKTIGTAIVTSCKASRRDYLLKHDPSSAAIARTFEPASTGEIDVATTVVLQGRARSPAPAAPKAKPKAKGEQI